MIYFPGTISDSHSAKIGDRLIFGLLYGLIAVIVFLFGFRMINHAWEVRFFKDYLLRWEVSINEFETKQGIWPVFSGSNHTAYMDSVMAQFRYAGILLPKSNTTKVYRYLIEGFGCGKEDIFVLVFYNRLILYGISEKTLTYLEKTMDKKVDFEHGRISGRIGKNKNIYIGQWRL